MLGMHLYDTLTVFLLMILCNGFDFGKHSFMMFKNFLPTLVDTFREKGGLKPCYIPGPDLWLNPTFNSKS